MITKLLISLVLLLELISHPYNQVENYGELYNDLSINFNDFIKDFNTETLPFNLKNTTITSQIKEEFIIKFIDYNYLKEDSILRTEAYSDEYYNPQNYLRAFKIDFNDKYLLGYIESMGNIGPNYTLAFYSKAGEFLDSIHFNVFEVYVNKSEQAIIYKDSIVWTGAGSIEVINIGENGHFLRTNSKKLKITPQGIYPQSSTRHLTRTELKKRSKHDLQIMRNEIFARYGYIFKEGGEMDKYFKSQEWYSPQHKNVNDFLTEIEKANLKLIREVEAE